MSPLSAADRFEQHLIAGGELLRQGRLPDAIRELHLALEIEPESTKALALLGLAHFRGGNFGEARPVYERLVTELPGDASHLLNLGLVHLKLGDAEGAIAALERSRALDPSQGRAVNYLGLAYARAGRFAEAYQAFLLAGQSDLAREISENLAPEERAAIEDNLRRPAKSSTTPPPLRPEVLRPGSEPPRSSGVPRAPLVEPKSGRITIEPRRPGDARGEPTEPPAAPQAPAPEPVRIEAVTIEPRKAPEAAPPEAPAGADEPDDDDLQFEVDRGPAVVHAGRPAPERDPSDSQRFVSHLFKSAASAADRNERAIAAAVETDARGAISRAVAQAAPAAAAASGLRVAAGSRPPQPLSEFATARLVRPEDGDHPFEISAGGVLIVRVTEKMFTRTEGVDVTGGRLAYEPAMRRSRGQNRDEPFETGGRPLFAVTGHGHLIAAPLGGQFTAVSLDEDIFYLREDLVFAFEPSLRWENGHVPGSRHRIPMVQFRGTGAIAFRTERPLLAVKLAQDRVLYIDATALAGWIGRVVPRAVTPADSGPTSELFVECAGEGVVLVQEEQAPVRPAPGV